MIKLVAATVDDVALLKYWDTQQHVFESDPNDDWNWEVELGKQYAWREQLIAQLDGQPIGFVQIIDPAEETTHYWGDVGAGKRAIDIWIGEKENLGKGYGTVMMQLALRRCFANTQVKEVLIDPLESNTKAIRFYKRLGFELVENRIFGEDACAVFALSRKTYQNLMKP